jgi:hypothetical protein
VSPEFRKLAERAVRLAGEATLEAFARFTKDGTAEVPEVIDVHGAMVLALLEQLAAMEAKAA